MRFPREKAGPALAWFGAALIASGPAAAQDGAAWPTHVLGVLEILAIPGLIGFALFQRFHFKRQGCKLRAAMQDLDARQKKLRKSEQEYRDLVENANSIIIRLKPSGEITFVNEYAQTFFDYSEEELIGKNLIGMLAPEREDSGRDLHDLVRHISSQPEVYAYNENENIKRDGSRVWVAWTNRLVHDEAGAVDEILCVGTDITRRFEAEQKLRENEERMRAILDAVPFPLIVTQLHDNRLLFINQHATHLFGVAADEAVGKDIPHCYEDPDDLDRLKQMVLAHGEIRKFAFGGPESDPLAAGVGLPAPLVMTSLKDQRTVVISDEGDSLVDELNDILLREQAEAALPADSRGQLMNLVEQYGRVTGFEVRLKSWRGKRFWALVSAVLMDFGGEAALYVAFNDITGRKALEEDLKRMATTDAMTGAFNRRRFMEVGTHEIDRSRRSTRPLSAVLMDIDKFKRINDTYGHAVGDEAIRSLARTCKAELRDYDIFGRLGGEEFAALLPETSHEMALDIADRLRMELAKIVVETGDETLQYTVSMGVATLADTDIDLEALLHRADLGLYAAKNGGRNRVVSYRSLETAAVGNAEKLPAE